jgi:hypothetical protein
MNTRAATIVATIGAGAVGQQGGDLDRVVHNLEDAFILVDGHEVHPMSSANLAIAMNELGRLPMTSKVAKATAMIKAATV